MIPYGRQEITQDDIDAVVDVLRSDLITQGPAVPRFEKALAQYCCAEHAVAVSSGTAALHVACLAMGLGPGDWLWTSPITFVASANCGIYCGANIDFVDVDPVTHNLSARALEEKLQHAERTGTVPKIVVPVHFAGQPCDLREIAQLAEHYGFRILEDASHAIGASYRDDQIGACRYSDATVFSFHPVKNLTTGEGGAVVTNDGDLAARARRLRSHGVTRDAGQMSKVPDGPWYYEQVELGYNYRMTDFQAALGTSQLRRMDDWVSARRELVARYETLLDGLPLIQPRIAPGRTSAWHLYTVELHSPLSSDRARIFDSMRSKGWGVNVHYIPVYRHPIHRCRFAPQEFPQAEEYYARAITLPLFPALSCELQAGVTEDLASALAGC